MGSGLARNSAPIYLPTGQAPVQHAGPVKPYSPQQPPDTGSPLRRGLAVQHRGSVVSNTQRAKFFRQLICLKAGETIRAGGVG